ncbi:hypothetical protein N9W34_07055, partial [Rickettsiales bacterium]|nr:hypothetical protein [Rickettsiales bacterium]
DDLFELEMDDIKTDESRDEGFSPTGQDAKNNSERDYDSDDSMSSIDEDAESIEIYAEIAKKGIINENGSIDYDNCKKRETKLESEIIAQLCDDTGTQFIQSLSEAIIKNSMVAILHELIKMRDDDGNFTKINEIGEDIIAKPLDLAVESSNEIAAALLEKLGAKRSIIRQNSNEFKKFTEELELKKTPTKNSSYFRDIENTERCKEESSQESGSSPSTSFAEEYLRRSSSAKSSPARAITPNGLRREGSGRSLFD